jgi:hypothetical protein
LLPPPHPGTPTPTGVHRGTPVSPLPRSLSAAEARSTPPEVVWAGSGAQHPVCLTSTSALHLLYKSLIPGETEALTVQLGLQSTSARRLSWPGCAHLGGSQFGCTRALSLSGCSQSLTGWCRTSSPHHTRHKCSTLLRGSFKDSGLLKVTSSCEGPGMAWCTSIAITSASLHPCGVTAVCDKDLLATRSFRPQ